MKDLIDRKAVLKIINDELEYSDNIYATSVCITIRRAVNDLPSAQPNVHDFSKDADCISRQQAIDALDVLCQEHRYKIPGKRETYSQYNEAWQDALDRAEGAIFNLPSAQPERYTKEELRVFAHGISLSLLSKRSAQHWQYDKDTATEIEFLERLYDKVSANMKGGQG